MDNTNQTDDTIGQTVDPTVVPTDSKTKEPSEPSGQNEIEKDVPTLPEEESPEAGSVVEDVVAPVDEPAAESNSVASSSEPSGTDQQGRQLYTVKCSTCGNDTQVPFKPTEGRPVYCRDDFLKMKNGQQ